MELRQPSSSSDLDQTWEILRRSFNAAPSERSDWDARMEPDRFWGLYEHDELLATAQVWSWSQCWGGRLVPCDGIASVGVDPTQRGRGLAKRLMTELLPVLGAPTSALMPATTSLYRSVGYDAAARCSLHLLATSTLLSLPRPTALRARRAERSDLAAIADIQRRAAAAHHGWIALSDAWWERVAVGWDSSFWYVVDGRGFVRLSQEDVEWGFRTTVQDAVALDHEALLALLHVVGSSSTMSPDVVVPSWMQQALVLLLPEQDLRPPHRQIEMLLRLVDLPAAIAARGWPAGLSASVALSVTDAVLPTNAGPWVLTVDDGAATLEPGGSGDVAVDIGTLASLYAGWASTATLAEVGRLAAPVLELDAAFGVAGPVLVPTYF